VVGASTLLKSRYTSSSYRNFSSSIGVVSIVTDYDQWLQLQTNLETPDAPRRQYAFSQYFLDVTDALACGRTRSYDRPFVVHISFDCCCRCLRCLRCWFLLLLLFVLVCVWDDMTFHFFFCLVCHF
jgi:hypothetical protein